MSQAAIIQAIRDRFDTYIAPDATSPPTVVHDNAPEPPARNQSWIRFSVLTNAPNQVSMGVARYRVTGTATAMIFSPIAKGDAAPLAIADSIITAFRGVKIASPDITFTPPPGVLGTAEQDDAWCKRTVTIPFRADTVET